MKTLAGKRILVCGKGGCGKSSIVTAMAQAIRNRGYATLVVDGDASNPEGLIRLMFGRSIHEAPRALIDFFGGIDTVTCPVDDPAPLTRKGDSRPVPEHRIDLDGELPPDYSVQEDGIRLVQAGKIENYGQGCDGPVEKVVRDFLVQGDWVTLIDMKAGVEHFGRRVPDTMDEIITVLDPTLESVSIAKRVERFCREMSREHFWFVINKVDSPEIESLMEERLGDLRDHVIARVGYDPALPRKVLKGGRSITDRIYRDVQIIVDKLEERLVPA
jgi:CO dehydrogenase maturation factor